MHTFGDNVDTGAVVIAVSHQKGQKHHKNTAGDDPILVGKGQVDAVSLKTLLMW